MFIRTTRVKKGDRTYCYGQLVKAYRRPDGQPRQKVIASLGKMSELEVANLRIALKAATAGVSVAPQGASADTPVVSSSLDYMSIAVVLEMSKRVGLTELLSRLLDDGTTSSPNSEVVLALIAQRLIAPGSKLASVRWFHRTALPELLSIPANEFNNSRLHRVLEVLGKVRAQLQLGVAQLHQDSTQRGHALFIDVSDTWFEGRGPKPAQTAKTKEGAYKKKIGIVLTCTKRGLPVRWDVVAGRRHDSQSMGDMAAQLVRIPGLSKLPMVFDRAMGKKKTLQELTDAGVRFVTLMTRDSYEGYAAEELDLPELAVIEPKGEEDVQAEAVALNAVQTQGFKNIGSGFWGKALSVRRYSKRATRLPERPPIPSRRKPARGSRPHVVQAMRMADEFLALKETGATNKTICVHLGIERRTGYDLRKLFTLHPDIRKEVRDGQSSASIAALKQIASLAPEDQLVAFAPSRLASEHTQTVAPKSPKPQESLSGPPVQFVLAFDSAAFVMTRFKANAQDREVRKEAESLCAKMIQGQLKRRTAELRIAKLLAKHSISDCYEVTVTESTVRVRRCEDVWKRKRRTDGFRLFAVHPELRVTPKRVINLYREKMAVEVDFHVIKSIVRIRPVFHAVEAKVRAHVDICVLALAVERAITDALPKGLSASTALEQLETIRLTCVAPNPKTAPTRVLTTPTTDQERILQHLNMLHLTQIETM